MRKRIPDKIKRILIVYKKSAYEKHALDLKDVNYLRLLRERNPAIRRSKISHDSHVDALERIRRQLAGHKIRFDVTPRGRLRTISGYDLVLTIGGDGTFLDASHYLRDGLILGINSAPEDSVGFFCHATADTFLEKIDQILHGTGRIRTLHRLAMTINKKPVWPLALNDILFTNTNPAGTTRYILTIGRKREEHKSSGLWVSPAPGSTAATRSAGGKRLPLEAQEIQYVVRELYAPSGKSYRLTRGILRAQASLEILSLIEQGGIYIDGPHTVHKVRRGSKIVIRNAHRPIYAVW